MNSTRLLLVSASMLLALTMARAADTIPPELRRGLVLYFNFDRQEPAGVVTDQSGSGNHGKVTGATWTAAGRKGGAYQFAPTENYISVPNNNSLNVKQITLAAWIKTAWFDTVWRRIFDKQWDHGFALSIGGLGENKQNKRSQGKVTLEINCCSDGNKNTSDAVVTDGEWHHIVATFDGTEQRLYVDGKLQKQIAPWKGAVADNPHGLTIGANLSNPNPKFGEVGASFVGIIDEAMMYNRALSEDEVKSLYESAGGAIAVPTSSSELASITVKSTPDGADITVDGKFSGNTPATLRLPAGDHTIRVSSAGFRNWERTLTVTPGGTATLNAALQREQ